MFPKRPAEQNLQIVLGSYAIVGQTCKRLSWIRPRGPLTPSQTRQYWRRETSCARPARTVDSMELSRRQVIHQSASRGYHLASVSYGVNLAYKQRGIVQETVRPPCLCRSCHCICSFLCLVDGSSSVGRDTTILPQFVHRVRQSSLRCVPWQPLSRTIVANECRRETKPEEKRVSYTITQYCVKNPRQVRARNRNNVQRCRRFAWEDVRSSERCCNGESISTLAAAIFSNGESCSCKMAVLQLRRTKKFDELQDEFAHMSVEEVAVPLAPKSRSRKKFKKAPSGAVLDRANVGWTRRKCDSLGTLCTFLAGERVRKREGVNDTHVQNGDVEANTCSKGESKR